jgi:hypothetical protein
VRREHVLRNAIYAVREFGDAALPDICRLLTYKRYRKAVIARLSNDQVRAVNRLGV